MRIKDGFDLREVCGDNLIIATGRENIDFSKIVTLNDTAAYLWRTLLGRDFQAQDMADALLAEYEVDEATAMADTETTIATWREIGLLE